MSKETTNNPSCKDGKKFKARKFKMAYSLNNWQPVQCTLVSDQPFFYMDEQCDFDDDSLLSEEFFEEFEAMSEEICLSEIASIQKKIDGYNNCSAQFRKKENQRCNEFAQNAESIEVINHANGHGIIDDTVIEEIKFVLGQSRMAKHLLEFAENNNVEILWSQQIDHALYDKKANKIFIRPDLTLEDQVLLLVQELRRHWQDKNGAMKDPLSLHPDYAILVHRAQRADLACHVIRCAWEMKLQGNQKIWARIEQSSLSDLGKALARESLNDFRTLNNGKALSAVFETWFLSERCRQEDQDLIQAMLAEHRCYVYGDEISSYNAASDVICKLGTQPFGKNYLASYAQMILSDALFTDVRDRSNANFLWFIKFERTFQETEQELHSSTFIKTNGIDRSDNKIKFEDNQYESGFFNPEGPKGFDNVIHVQFGRGIDLLSNERPI